MRRAALLVPLLALLGCGRRPGAEVVYAPHEEGLTLVFENPSLPAEQAFQNRLQVRVRHVSEAQGRRVVDETFTTLKGELASSLILEGGAVRLAGPDHRPVTTLLPAGFPDHTLSWVERERRYTVLGRAAAIEGYGLPPGAPRVGVWVEVGPVSGPVSGPGLRTRSFYLPDLGEVEYQEFRGGAWVPVVRLVSRGFTDAPVIRKN